MRHPNIFLIVFLFSCVCSFAQTVSLEPEPYPENVLKIHFNPFGFHLENRITEKMTIDYGLELDYWMPFYDWDDIDFVKAKAIVISVEPRWYLNLDKRVEKGRNYKNNSGIYGAFQFKGGISTQAFGFYCLAGPVIGLQQSFGKKAFLNVSVGPGVLIVDRELLFQPAGKLGFGFVIDGLL